jgi:hypothetical protein
MSRNDASLPLVQKKRYQQPSDTAITVPERVYQFKLRMDNCAFFHTK